MTGRIIDFPPPRRDFLEVALIDGQWSVTIARPGQMPMPLAEFDSHDGAEDFARHVAEVRGSTSLIVRRPA